MREGESRKGGEERRGEEKYYFDYHNTIILVNEARSDASTIQNDYSLRMT